MRGRFFVLLLALAFLLPLVSSATCNTTGNIVNLSSISNGCTFNSPGTYTFTASTFSINQSMQVQANGVVLEGNGAQIIYSNVTTNLPYGILVEAFNNTIIRNFILNQSINSKVGSNAIHLTTTTFNNTVRNNMMVINNLSSNGIYSKGGISNRFINNTVYDYIGGVVGNNSKAIELELGSAHNLVENNTIFTYGLYSHGVLLELHSFNNSLIGNRIFTNNYKSPAISIDTNATYTFVFNNNVTTNGSESEGLELLEDPINQVNNTNFNNISYNIFSTFSNFSYGIALTGTGVQNNFIFGNNVTTNGSSAHAFYNNGQAIANNTVFLNNFTTLGSSALGYYFLNGAGAIISYNNSITTFTSFSRGFRLDRSSNNQFTGDKIRTISSNNGQGVYIENGGTNNVFTNLSIITPTVNKIDLISGQPNVTIRNMNTVMAIQTANGFGNHSFFGSNLSVLMFGNVTQIAIDGIYDMRNLLSAPFNYTAAHDFLSIKNINTTSSENYPFFGLNNALLYNADGSIYGSAVISENDGNINITQDALDTSYVLDNFNLTEGVSRQFSPLVLSGSGTSRKITSQLSQEVTSTVVINYHLCPTTATYNGNSVDSIGCGSGTVTFNLEDIPAGESFLTLENSLNCSANTSASIILILTFSALAIVALALVLVWKWKEGEFDMGVLMIIFIAIMVGIALFIGIAQNLGGVCT